jgi:type II secretory pathway pseudopilin PulG
MKSIILAAVAALSLPAAALAHDEGYRQVRPPPPAPPAYAERREVAELHALTARLDAAPGWRDRREVAWIEAELLRACKREIAEARAAQSSTWHEVPGSRRDLAVGWSPPARARLDALLGVRAGLVDLRGRTDWAAIRQASALGHELTRLVGLDVRYDAPPPPPPARWDRDHDGYERHDGYRG